jgi:Kef-type K+ transport system membrane component KefB
MQSLNKIVGLFNILADIALFVFLVYVITLQGSPIDGLTIFFIIMSLIAISAGIYAAILLVFPPNNEALRMKKESQRIKAENCFLQKQIENANLRKQLKDIEASKK